MNEVITLAIIAAVVSIATAYFTSLKTASKTASKTVSDGAVKLEGRLATIETKLDGIKENMMTKEERACLVEVQTSLNWVITTALGDAVSGLRNPPALDGILTKIETEMATKGGYKAALGVLEDLTASEDQELTEYLEKTIKSDRSHLKRQRAHLVLNMKKLSADLKEKGVSCEV